MNMHGGRQHTNILLSTFKATHSYFSIDTSRKQFTHMFITADWCEIKSSIVVYNSVCKHVQVPKGRCASSELERVRAKDTLTISSPECGRCQVDMLKALCHIVAQESRLWVYLHTQ